MKRDWQRVLIAGGLILFAILAIANAILSAERGKKFGETKVVFTEAINAKNVAEEQAAIGKLKADLDNKGFNYDEQLDGYSIDLQKIGENKEWMQGIKIRYSTKNLYEAACDSIKNDLNKLMEDVTGMDE